MPAASSTAARSSSMTSAVRRPLVSSCGSTRSSVAVNSWRRTGLTSQAAAPALSHPRQRPLAAMAGRPRALHRFGGDGATGYHRQNEREGAAHVGSALHPQAAAVRLHQAAAECQTQPGALLLPDVGPVELLEL